MRVRRPSPTLHHERHGPRPLRALTAAAPQDTFHVRRSTVEDAWCIHHDAGWTRLWAPTKLAAVSVALRLARAAPPSRLLVHGAHGRIEVQRDYTG